MANAASGGGGNVTLSFQAGAGLLTSTAIKYTMVGLKATTTNGGFDSVVPCNSATIQPIGVLMVDMSASAEATIPVQVHGLTKVRAYDTVAAGKWVVPVVGQVGKGGPYEAGLTATAVSTTSHTVALGRCFQTGVTSDYISVYVNPQLIVRSYAAG